MHTQIHMCIYIYICLCLYQGQEHIGGRGTHLRRNASLPERLKSGELKPAAVAAMGDEAGASLTKRISGSRSSPILEGSGDLVSRL